MTNQEILNEFEKQGEETLNRLFKQGVCRCRSKAVVYLSYLKRHLETILNKK
jgi:hypothetical protein